MISYGMSDFIPFLKGLSLCLGVSVPTALYIWFKFDYKNMINQELEEKLKFTETEYIDLSRLNQEIVAANEEYEAIFDSQLWEIECNCGENTFIGLFSPYSENICECEKCKNRYRITLNYESILITDTTNNEAIFNDLKDKMTEEARKNDSLKTTIP